MNPSYLEKIESDEGDKIGMIKKCSCKPIIPKFKKGTPSEQIIDVAKKSIDLNENWIIKMTEEIEEYPDTSEEVEEKHSPESGAVDDIDLDDDMEPIPDKDKIIVNQSTLESFVGTIKKVSKKEPVPEKLIFENSNSNPLNWDGIVIKKNIVIQPLIRALDEGIVGIKEPTEKKPEKPNSRNSFLSLVTPEGFNCKNFTLSWESLPQNPNLRIFSSNYNYSDKNKSRLVIQTDFMDNVFHNPIKNKNETVINYNGLNSFPDKKQFNIKLNHKMFSESLIDFMKFYDNLIKKELDGLVYSYTNAKNLLNNVGANFSDEFNQLCDVQPIKAKISKDYEFKNFNKIINYNISKKYPKKEEFHLSNLTVKETEDLLHRVLTSSKQVRFLLTPVTWLNTGTHGYGSYLKIISMEIKFKNAKIFSQLDQNENNVANDIGTITI